jgi:hypothetical protein
MTDQQQRLSQERLLVLGVVTLATLILPVVPFLVAPGPSGTG